MLAPDPPSGRFDGSTHLFPVRVYFEDTDLSGVVYHANYLRWFERARSDMLRLLGIKQRAAHEAGEGAYAVTEMALRYLRPARLDDAVVVRSRVAEISPATCRIVQEAYRGEALLCDAKVRVAFVAPNGRPRRQPRDWVAAFHTVLAPSCEQEGPVSA
ncbi:YbgC/FadM family acyl-CoA thioesterase [Novosphingobium sp. KCTC 2891]|uniref:YbgC/FadM family acyl-CoA thioesterase n=1 Tax=Novosphingobium sp. KCTC 2891 TaxID=2989730 RepID=UPI002223553F|nr:YbgC/FadM family acyl-CoA thioesterase [Novosphingobium sp. KCTC 2891]MCW1382652.1 YbgC/FadM family acyl-CoA thioesterase [Novosphingobium sp. KCTC 2891]